MHTQTSKVTNWEKFRQQLNKNVKINTNLNSKEKINKEIAHFSHAISKYYQISTVTKVINNETIIPDNIKNVIKVKNSLRRRFQRTRDPNTKHEINRLTNYINSKINEIKAEKW